MPPRAAFLDADPTGLSLRLPNVTRLSGDTLQVSGVSAKKGRVSGIGCRVSGIGGRVSWVEGVLSWSSCPSLWNPAVGGLVLVARVVAPLVDCRYCDPVDNRQHTTPAPLGRARGGDGTGVAPSTAGGGCATSATAVKAATAVSYRDRQDGHDVGRATTAETRSHDDRPGGTLVVHCRKP
jgi:hypothetical protein